MGIKKRIRLFVEDKEKEIVTSNSNMPTPDLQISNKCILPATFQSQLMATHLSSDSSKHIFQSLGKTSSSIFKLCLELTQLSAI